MINLDMAELTYSTMMLMRRIYVSKKKVPQQTVTGKHEQFKKTIQGKKFILVQHILTTFYDIIVQKLFDVETPYCLN
jgi:hypothetical protein